MRKGFVFKAFIYFLSVSFLLMMNGLPAMGAEVKGKSISIVGEMVSRGEVKFEARENVWKKVESSHFPIFQGTKIRTEKGNATITLTENSQIEVSPNSLFSLDYGDQFVLSLGSIQFRIPSTSEINFKAGNISILKSRSFQATKDLSMVPGSGEETIGSITIHPSGSITVKNIKGKLSILNQDHVVLAALSSKDSITIPSTTAGTKPRTMVAQVGETVATEGTEFLGISPWGWVGIIAGGAAIVGGIVWAVSEAREEERRPVCP